MQCFKASVRAPEGQRPPLQTSFRYPSPAQYPPARCSPSFRSRWIGSRSFHTTAEGPWSQSGAESFQGMMREHNILGLVSWRTESILPWGLLIRPRNARPRTNARIQIMATNLQQLLRQNKVRREKGALAAGRVKGEKGSALQRCDAQPVKAHFRCHSLFRCHAPR